MIVDGADFLIWQRNAGLTTGALLENGDANADGAVNELDLTAWNENFGVGVTPPPVSAVPEPTTLALAGALLLAGVAARRRS